MFECIYALWIEGKAVVVVCQEVIFQNLREAGRPKTCKQTPDCLSIHCSSARASCTQQRHQSQAKTGMEWTSLLEDWGERRLDVAQIGSDRRRRSRLILVRHLELGLLFLSLDGHLASDRLLGVLLVVGELGQRLIVAALRRVRWPKRFVVQRARSCLGRSGPVWNRWVLFQDLAMGVEEVCMLGTLREVLVL